MKFHMPGDNYVIIYGGAFDPLHYGHLRIAKLAIDRCPGAELWFLPTYIDTEHKKAFTNFDLRVEMLLAAFKEDGLPYGVCVEEQLLGQAISTYAMLNHLSREHPDRRFIFLMGSDRKDNIRSWRNSRKLLAEYPIMVAHRQGYPPPAGNCWAFSPPHRYLFTTEPIPEYSSTQIKKELNEDWTKRPNGLPQSVFKYILEHDLYGTVRF